LKNGVWIDEAEIIKKIILVNKKVENALSGNMEECMSRLKEVSETDGMYIDPGFKINIASRFHEIDMVQKKIEALLSKSEIEFSDFDNINYMMGLGREFPFFIPNFEKLVDIFTVFDWTIKVGYNFASRGADLELVIGCLLHHLNDLRNSSSFKAIRDMYAPILKVKFTMQPFTEIVSETKYAFWLQEVSEYYNMDHLHLKELESLLDKAPINTEIAEDRCETMRNLRSHVQSAYAWKNEAQRLIRQASDLRTCSHEEFNRRMGDTFDQIEEVVRRVNEEYTEELKVIDELKSVKAGLEQAIKNFSDGQMHSRS
jgi:hypothetical protein